MIKIGDSVYRNLEEQVLKNKQDIADHWNVDRVLADFGIKVLGKFDSPEDLEDPAKVDKSTLTYGDGYLIGEEVPYDVYVWTRANLDAGHAEPYFLNIGSISIVGPQGPEGPQGPSGEVGQSTRWYTGSGTPTVTSDYIRGDMYLQSNGQVYMFTGSVWSNVANIKGPQGIQGILGIQGIQGIQGPEGPQGPKGDAGAFITIYGILNSTTELPLPTELNNLGAAYLVGSSAPYNLYIQVGESFSEALWTNAGVFNVATVVTVNGQYQSSWNADTKLDKITTVTNDPLVYAKAPDGTQKVYNVRDTQRVGTDNSSNMLPSINYVGSRILALNIKGSTTGNGVYQTTSDHNINFKDRNPHAQALDPTLGSVYIPGAEQGLGAGYGAMFNGNSNVLGGRAFAINNKCIAKGDESFAGGYCSVTLSPSCMAFGEQNVAKGNSSVALGNNTLALKNHSMAIGASTTANGVCALAGGNNTQAIGENSVALGANTVAQGPHSLALGDGSTTATEAYASIAAGLGTKTTGVYQAAFGRYNEGISGNIFEIGNGSSDTERETIFSVTRDGRAKADTLPSDNNDLTNKYYVDTKTANIPSLESTVTNLSTTATNLTASVEGLQANKQDKFNVGDGLKYLENTKTLKCTIPKLYIHNISLDRLDGSTSVTAYFTLFSNRATALTVIDIRNLLSNRAVPATGTFVKNSKYYFALVISVNAALGFVIGGQSSDGDLETIAFTTTPTIKDTLYADDELYPEA